MGRFLAKKLILLFAALFGFCSQKYHDIGRISTEDPDERRFEADVFFIPMSGVDDGTLQDLEQILESRHNINIETTQHLALTPDQFDDKHHQYVSEQIVRSAWRNIRNLRGDRREVPIIIFLESDLNSWDFKSRFWFSHHNFKHRITVVSFARIDPQFFGFRRNPDLKLLRAQKLVNKALGYHLYGYDATSDPKSVMYTPIQGIKDLDRIGVWYE